MNDLALRSEIYDVFADTGRAPTSAWVAGRAGGAADGDAALRRLHDQHLVVLDDAGEIDMALPFSSKPTEHRVFGDGRSWWANCAWDALAIAAALDVDVRIDSTWFDSGEPVRLSVIEGELDAPDGLVNFVVPARGWWDDIRET